MGIHFARVGGRDLGRQQCRALGRQVPEAVVGVAVGVMALFQGGEVTEGVLVAVAVDGPNMAGERTFVLFVP
jgi:hypothetical protein